MENKRFSWEKKYNCWMNKNFLHWTPVRCRAKWFISGNFYILRADIFIMKCIYEIQADLREWGVWVVATIQASRGGHTLGSELSACHHLPSSSSTHSRCIIHIFCLRTHMRRHTHTQPLYHLWLTRDSRCHCQPWNVAASLCVKDLPGFLYNRPGDAASQSHQILFICSLLFVWLFLAHPTLCLRSASVFFSVSPELHRKHKEGGRKLILWYCWVGLVLSYDSEHRGRGITRQIGYTPVISSYKNWWYVAALAAKVITASSDSFSTFLQQTAQAVTENKRKIPQLHLMKCQE